MIEKLLREIRTGGTLQPVTLASRLGISVGLINLMLEDLEHRGLIMQYQAPCGDGCGKCALSANCTSNTREKGRIWMLK